MTTRDELQVRLSAAIYALSEARKLLSRLAPEIGPGSEEFTEINLRTNQAFFKCRTASAALTRAAQREDPPGTIRAAGGHVAVRIGGLQSELDDWRVVWSDGRNTWATFEAVNDWPVIHKPRTENESDS